MKSSLIGKKGLPLAGWLLYDLANQFFALNIVSLYFPRWIVVEKGSPEIFYSLAFGASMLLVAFCAPFLGMISDAKNKRRTYLIVFTLLSVAFTAALGFSKGLFWALLFFAIANFGCQEAIIFYNALLINVAPKGKIGFISGLGRMFGYIGAILALYVSKPIVANMGYQVAFLLTAIFFLVFSLPCMFFVKENKQETPACKFSGREGISLTLSGMKEIYHVKGFKNFLVASFSLICAVSTIMLFMSVYASKALGLLEGQIVDLIIFSTLFAVLGSILSGYISDFIGYGRALKWVFILWTISFLGAGLLSQPFHLVAGALIGFSLGATWVVLRTLVIKLVSQENISKGFALFNLVGYSAAVAGPVFWGLILLFYNRFGAIGYRVALLNMIIFILAGAVFLGKMRKEVHVNGELSSGL